MALVLADRIQETASAPGTATLTLAGASLGYKTFASGVGSGNTTYYTIVDATANVWEVGIGTVGTGTLSRDTVLSNSSGTTAKINFANSVTVWCDYPAGKSVYLDGSNVLTLSVPEVISVNSASDALRITQTGAGNALLVEDSANPDSTPFVVDANGKAIVGHTSALATVTYTGAALTPNLQTQGVGMGVSAFGVANWANNSQSPASIVLSKSKSNAVGTFGVVASGDVLGSLSFTGDDGTAFINAAYIQAQVDGTPGTNDMPGRLVFSTTADGASSPTERMRITSSGAVGIGTALTQVNLYNTRNLSGNATSYGNYLQATVQSDVTSAAHGYRSALSTAASAFTVGAIYNFYANQGTIGAGSSITNQFGFVADSTLTGATNNYGFYSNIASGTGRYNFYAGGTAANYFAGQILLAANRELVIGGTDTANNPQLLSDGTYLQLNAPNASGDIRFRAAGSERMKIDSAGRVGIGTSSLTGYLLRGTGNLSGSASSRAVDWTPDIQSDVSSTAYIFSSVPTVQNAAFTLTSLGHFRASQGIKGAAATITNQFGFYAESSITGATNNYGFYSNIASGTGRYNFYAAGTADNYFAGTVTSNATLQGSAVSASNGLFVNNNTVSANYTIPTNYNASSAGPVTVASGITVTIPSGSNWVVV